ncbi:SIP domain-containing protein [Gordonia sp. ABSL11-1]|uniref:siderophore-interacting protein n=1 Tax=Gordonia sp. ABSL11-1 TaxID=3053924 RepID=UPI0025736EDF|nr:siderophore-interacting protein [Gordonia sp. ABSL11-1]MDL9948141.1 SIP domain-containing protein [Gordonia sp. ABSL11-1]
MVTEHTAATEEPSIAEQVAEVNPRLVEHYNANYADAVEIICRARLGTDVDGAKLTGIEVDALALRATTHDGIHHEITASFSHRATTLLDIEALMIEVIADARTTLGITTLSVPEAQAQQLGAIRTYITEVTKVERVTPTFAQITFGGGDLASYTPGGHDQFLYVMTPPAGRTDLTVDASFSREDFGRFTDENRPVGGYYTLRRWRPESAEIDMLFVLHGIGENSHAEPGPSARWAAGARPGDPVALWGPRTIYEPPADTDWVLLVGDETGLPAICVILEHLPEDTSAHVFVEIGDERDRLDLPEREGIHITWLVRGDSPAGTTDLLLDAVRELDLPEGNVYAWGGAEARTMRSVTNYLRRKRAVERRRVRMTGYWHHMSTPPDLNADDD